MSDTLLRIKSVQQKTGLSRSTVYKLAKVGDFPSPIKLSERCSAWVAADVDQWIDSKIKAAKQNQQA